MNVIPNGKSVVIEYSSNAEVAKHIKLLTEMLQNKLENPRKMAVCLISMVNAHGEPSGELVHRTEY